MIKVIQRATSYNRAYLSAANTFTQFPFGELLIYSEILKQGVKRQINEEIIPKMLSY